MPSSLRLRGLPLTLAGCFLLAACSIAPATPTPTPRPTSASTPKIPLEALLPTLAATATATPTAIASPTATPALPSGLGTLLLKESFQGLSGNWGVATGPAGAISFLEGHLVMSLRKPQTSLVSLYAQAVPSSLYMQALADTSLCDTGKNEFGFVFRASGSYQYRAAFSCDGQLRFERHHGLELEGASGWQPTRSLVAGAPAENQIGLRASGGRFSFYANNQLIYSYVDTLVTAGQVGLFASTGQGSLLTVAFKDFQLWTLAGEAGAPSSRP